MTTIFLSIMKSFCWTNTFLLVNLFVLQYKTPQTLVFKHDGVAVILEVKLQLSQAVEVKLQLSRAVHWFSSFRLKERSKVRKVLPSFSLSFRAYFQKQGRPSFAHEVFFLKQHPLPMLFLVSYNIVLSFSSWKALLLKKLQKATPNWVLGLSFSASLFPNVPFLLYFLR